MADESSQRAREVSRDLLSTLRDELQRRDLLGRVARFHLDGSDQFLDWSGAENWIRESVDAGFPEVRYVIEHADDTGVVINLAAFQDPDSQYWEPAGRAPVS